MSRSKHSSKCANVALYITVLNTELKFIFTINNDSTHFVILTVKI